MTRDVIDYQDEKKEMYRRRYQRKENIEEKDHKRLVVLPCLLLTTYSRSPQDRLA
jgi:hypothetical protein